jgi:hypothetical protein
MMNSRLVLAGIVCLWSLGCSEKIGPVGSEARPVLMLADFSSGDVAGWEALSSARVSLAEKAGVGSSAAMCFLAPKYDGAEGEDRWPQVKYSEFGAIAGLEGYDFIVADCFLAEGLPAQLRTCVTTKAGKKVVDTSSMLKPGEWIEVRRSLTRGGLSHAEIGQFGFYLTEPASEMKIYIDNVRLESAVPEAMAELAARYEAAGLNAAEIRTCRKNALTGEIALKEARARLRELERGFRRGQSDAMLVRYAARHQGAGFAVAFADSTRRIFTHEMPLDAELAESWRMSLARGEYEAFQAVVIAPSDKPLKNVKATVENLKNGSGGILAEAQAFPVGFVKTRPSRHDVSYVGWYPDPILEFMEAVEVKAGEAQPFWVRVKADGRTEPGIYRGNLIVCADGMKTQSLPLEVEVWDFTLSKTGHLRTATSIYTSDLLPPARKLEAIDWALDRYRLNAFSIYEGGVYENTELTALETYRQRVPLGLNGIPLLYLKLPRQALHTGKNLGSRKSKEEWSKLSPEQQRHYPPEEKERILDILAKLVPEYKKAGIWGYCYVYGFDEATPSEWPAVTEVCREIKARYPDLEIVSTAYDHSFGTETILGDALDGWIPHLECYNFNVAEKARAGGKKVWWYSTLFLIDEKPLWAMRNAMGAQAWRLKVDGFLYWTITRWQDSNKKPVASGPYTEWNPETHPRDNGGGSFVCMGPEGKLLPTVRLENIRDGLEDYEYFWLLADLLKAIEKNAPAKVLSAMRAALEISPELADLRYADSYPNDPRLLLEKREQAARAIVLGRKYLK